MSTWKRILKAAGVFVGVFVAMIAWFTIVRAIRGTTDTQLSWALSAALWLVPGAAAAQVLRTGYLLKKPKEKAR